MISYIKLTTKEMKANEAFAHSMTITLKEAQILDVDLVELINEIGSERILHNMNRNILKTYCKAVFGVEGNWPMFV